MKKKKLIGYCKVDGDYFADFLDETDIYDKEDFRTIQEMKKEFGNKNNVSSNMNIEESILKESFFNPTGNYCDVYLPVFKDEKK